MLHQGQEVALGLGVLHSVDQDFKYVPHIIEAKTVKAQQTRSIEEFNTNMRVTYTTSKEMTVNNCALFCTNISCILFPPGY